MIDCPVCAKSTDIILTSDFDKEYHLCSNCELIFLDSKYFISHEEEKDRYSKHDNNAQNKGYVKMFKNFISVAIEPFIQEGMALEFGCGHGPVLGDMLKDMGFLVDLYDYYFYPEWEPEKDKYDLVTTTEVLEHIANPNTAFEVFSKVIKPGGLLSLMTLFAPQDKSVFSSWWYAKDDTHIVFYTEKTIAYLAKKYGFDIVFCNGKNICTLRKKL